MPLLFLSNTTENEISWICINYSRVELLVELPYSNTVILIFILVLVGHNI